MRNQYGAAEFNADVEASIAAGDGSFKIELFWYKPGVRGDDPTVGPYNKFDHRLVPAINIFVQMSVLDGKWYLIYDPHGPAVDMIAKGTGVLKKDKADSIIQNWKRLRDYFVNGRKLWTIWTPTKFNRGNLNEEWFN